MYMKACIEIPRESGHYEESSSRWYQRIASQSLQWYMTIN